MISYQEMVGERLPVLMESNVYFPKDGIVFGRCVSDKMTLRLRLDDEEMFITPDEYKLLAGLMKSGNTEFTGEEIVKVYEGSLLPFVSIANLSLFIRQKEGVYRLDRDAVGRASFEGYAMSLY